MLDYLLFMSAFIASAITPGADTFFVLTRAISSPRLAFIAAAGIAFAKALMVAFVFLGLAAVLQASPAILWGLKIFGAIFLLFRAYKLWIASDLPKVSAGRSGEFISGFAIGFSNPQPWAFYLSVIPLVINTTELPLLLAIVILGFMLVAALYVALAKKLSGWLRKMSNFQTINRLVAVIFFVLAVIVLTR